MYNTFQNLIQLFSQLPGIGHRSATRIIFSLLKKDENFCIEFAEAIKELKNKIFFCKVCGSLTDSETCEICINPKRELSQLCIVEEPNDVILIEKTGAYLGLYHVLMGALSPLDGIGPNEIRLKSLFQRIEKFDNLKEIFIATNPTLEGDATADYIRREIKEMDKSKKYTITRISHGIPTGSSIEYAETRVLARSINARIAF